MRFSIVNSQLRKRQPSILHLIPAKRMGGIHERIGLCFQYGDVYVAGQAAPVNEQLDVFGHSASYHEECQQVVCLKSP